MLPPSVVSLGTNPARAAPEWPPAVIAGAYQTGVLGVRSLTRRGVTTVCFDSNRRNPGFRSVYGRTELCPVPESDPQGWVQFMRRLGQSMRERPVLISSSDQFVTAVARHAQELEAWYILSPGYRLQGLLAEKQSQYELAASHGMPMPKTVFARSSDDVEAFAREAAFPCLIKPTHFREWQRFSAEHPLYCQKVSIAQSAEQLLRSHSLAASVNPNVIVQEIIQGADMDKRVYLSCYDRNGQRVANAMFRELRCDPVGFGPASISEPVVDHETDEICDRFLRSIGYMGICEIEMKRDSKDGRVKLIEANPRLSGGGDAAPYAGVDLCWLHYLDLIGQPVKPVAPRAVDFRHVVLRAEGRALPAYVRAGLASWRDVLHSYRPPLKFYDLDVKDWRYSLETLFVAARELVKGIFKRGGS